MAQELGVPVEDVDGEVLAIRPIMTEEAARLADALGSEKHAADFLGIPNFDAGDATGVDTDAGGTAPPPGAGVDAGAPGVPPAGGAEV